MAYGKSTLKFDWITILLFLALVAIGWVNIYSASLNDNATAFFDISQIYMRQLLFIALSIVLIVFVLAVDSKFYERFSSIIYLVSLVFLLGLFLFGKNINGATSWYSFGSFGLQPRNLQKLLQP